MESAQPREWFVASPNGVERNGERIRQVRGMPSTALDVVDPHRPLVEKAHVSVVVALQFFRSRKRRTQRYARSTPNVSINRA